MNIPCHGCLVVYCNVINNTYQKSSTHLGLQIAQTVYHEVILYQRHIHNVYSLWSTHFLKKLIKWSLCRRVLIMLTTPTWQEVCLRCGLEKRPCKHWVSYLPKMSTLSKVYWKLPLNCSAIIIEWGIIGWVTSVLCCVFYMGCLVFSIHWLSGKPATL